MFLDAEGVPVIVEVKRSSEFGSAGRSSDRCWTTRRTGCRTGLTTSATATHGTLCGAPLEDKDLREAEAATLCYRPRCVGARPARCRAKSA
jgi:hypothetical protein